MILGTANIFNVDQRTAALISHRMRHASKERQEEALKLAAMAEMCIYHPTPTTLPGDGRYHFYTLPSSPLTTTVDRERKFVSIPSSGIFFRESSASLKEIFEPNCTDFNVR